jgi:hypothetical protein
LPFIERTRDDTGRLFLKYFLADDTLNDRGWRLSPESLQAFAQSFKGKPFTLVKDKSESLFGDYHPFAPKESATIQEDIDFAEKYAIGHIIDVTPTPKDRLGAGASMGFEAIIEIEDPMIKTEFLKEDTHLIPPEVSPGVVRLAGSRDNVEEFWGLHLAAVPQGAYGPRAREIARCSGEHQACVHTLLAAASERDQKIFQHLLPPQFLPTAQPPWLPQAYQSNTGSCPIGALENLAASTISSSHSTENTNSNSSMSYNATGSVGNSSVGKAPAPHYGTSTFSSPTGATIATQNYNRPQQGQAPVQQVPLQQAKPKIVLKNPKRFLVNTNLDHHKTPEELEKERQEQEQQQKPEGEQQESLAAPSIAQADPKVLKELEELRKTTAAQERRWKLANMIPRDLFVDKNGRFREKDWQQAIDDTIARNIPDDLVVELYELKKKALQYPEIAAVPQARKNTGRLGASSIAIQNSSSQVNEEQDKIVKLLQLNGGL